MPLPAGIPQRPCLPPLACIGLFTNVSCQNLPFSFVFVVFFYEETASSSENGYSKLSPIKEGNLKRIFLTSLCISVQYPD